MAFEFGKTQVGNTTPRYFEPAVVDACVEGRPVKGLLDSGTSEITLIRSWLIIWNLSSKKKNAMSPWLLQTATENRRSSETNNHA